MSRRNVLAQETLDDQYTEDPSSTPGSNHESRNLFILGMNGVTTANHETNAALCRKIKRGNEEALETLVRTNIPFVITIARIYEGLGVDIRDLVIVGSTGLIRAAKDYNPSFGTTFSTYAGPWIRQAIRRELSKNRATIRLPVHVGELSRKVHKIKLELQQEFGREATSQEIAKAAEITLEKLEFILSLPQAHSLDKEISGESNDSFHEFFESSAALPPYFLAQARDEYRIAVRSIRTLIDLISRAFRDDGDRNTLIFCQRYGLFGNGPMRTLETVGQMHGITRERVRQVGRDIFEYAGKPSIKHPISNEKALLATIECIRTSGEILWEFDGKIPDDYHIIPPVPEKQVRKRK